jgi:hypothetical protein
LQLPFRCSLKIQVDGRNQILTRHGRDNFDLVSDPPKAIDEYCSSAITPT